MQASAFGLSAQAAQAVFAATGGTDPLFAPVDGANCPSVTPADGAAGHSLLLNQGLIRVGLTIPAGAEYAITAVHDPYGCALRGSPAEASVYRRVLPTTNLRFLSAVMWDGRETVQPLTDRNTFPANLRAGLLHQAMDATLGHAQAAVSPTASQLDAIVDFELALFTAQQTDNAAGVLQAQQGTGGPAALASAAVLPRDQRPAGRQPDRGGRSTPAAFTLFKSWKDLGNSGRYASAAEGGRAGRGGLQHPPAHDHRRGGPERCPGRGGDQRDLHHLPRLSERGQSFAPAAARHRHQPRRHVRIRSPGARGAGTLSTPDLPVFQVECQTGPLAGTVRYTSDPGRALISGKCADIGRLKGPILRGLTARAPFFHNGAAATLTPGGGVLQPAIPDGADRPGEGRPGGVPQDALSAGSTRRDLASHDHQVDRVVGLDRLQRIGSEEQQVRDLPGLDRSIAAVQMERPGRVDRGGREQPVQRDARARQPLELQEAVQPRRVAEGRTGRRVTAEHEPAAVRHQVPGGQRAVVGRLRRMISRIRPSSGGPELAPHLRPHTPARRAFGTRRSAPAGALGPGGDRRETRDRTSRARPSITRSVGMKPIRRAATVSSSARIGAGNSSPACSNSSQFHIPWAITSTPASVANRQAASELAWISTGSPRAWLSRTTSRIIPSVGVGRFLAGPKPRSSKVFTQIPLSAATRATAACGV